MEEASELSPTNADPEIRSVSFAIPSVLVDTADLDSTVIKNVLPVGTIKDSSADFQNMEEELAILGNSEMD